MNTKLTLSIDSVIIDKAKKNLSNKDKSLSGIIQDYFEILISVKNKRTPSTPVVEELTGIAKLNKNKDEKDIVTEYLLKKYK